MFQIYEIIEKKTNYHAKSHLQKKRLNGMPPKDICNEGEKLSAHTRKNPLKKDVGQVINTRKIWKSVP